MTVKIWFQTMSSTVHRKDFTDRLQKCCDRVALADTIVDLHGSTSDGMGDQFQFCFHFDTIEVLKNALRVRKTRSHDAFVLANSLDPGLGALREVMDIPVVSLLEVACFAACTMGERFGLVAANPRLMPRYRDLIYGYGLSDRFAGIDCIHFGSPAERNAMFADPAVGDRAVEQFLVAARRTLERGADVLVGLGPTATLIAERGIHQVDGAPVIDTFSHAVKAAETAVALHRQTGVCVSRRGRYEGPSADVLRRAAEIYALEDLRDG